MSLWEQEVNDHTLTAHWRMNEIEGVIAVDSAGQRDGTLRGDPMWKPEDGIIDGALAVDGIDDYVDTSFVLDPSEGSFSVFVWIKGGVPGQVVVSQLWGVNWLMADLIDGALRTDLKNPAGTGRGAAPPGPPLISQTVITDGYWHRVGFVRDGSNRILYVDDIEVAHDTADDLVECGQSPVQADLGTLTKPSRRPETERNVRLQGGRSRRCEHRRWRPTPQMDIAASRSQQGFVRVP